MNISVQYEDTDIALVLRSMIKHPNAEEFVKLLTPMICKSSKAANLIFKLHINHKLPEVLPKGTICKIPINRVTYDDQKRDLLRKTIGDHEDKILATVKEFNGYDQWSEYILEYVTKSGKEIAHLDYSYIEVVEEF
jgi:hypothetical protein